MKNTVTCISILALLSGCANTAPEPIRVSRASDTSLNCTDIKLETSLLLQRLGISEQDISRKKVQNVTAWISGQLLLVPTLAMDVSGSSNIEAKAITLRMERLSKLSANKKC